MSLSDVTIRAADEAAVQPSDNSGLHDAARNLAASLDAAITAGEAGSFSDDAMRELMAALVKIYATKFDEGQRPMLIGPDSGVSATAVLMTTSALMKSSNLEIFELGMWQSWSGTR
jgi:hypothetical protein